MYCTINRICMLEVVNTDFKFRFTNLVSIVAILCQLVMAGCKQNSPQQIQSRSPVSSSPGPVLAVPSQQQQHDCLVAAKKALGAKAEVVKCGEINTPGIQEAIAVVPGKFPSGTREGLPILKLVILRHEPSGWRTVLTADRQFQNEVGYIGLDYIDDYYHFYGYWLTFSHASSNGKNAMIIDLLDIENADGTSEASSTEIAWNPAVGRYQEWAYYQDPEGFRPEIKNPPHWKPGVKLSSTPSK